MGTPTWPDNLPLKTWPSTAPQYENWYALVNHPARRWAFWMRMSLLTTSTGHREARAWAITHDADAPGDTRILTQALTQDAFRVEGGNSLLVGDAARLTPTRMEGHVKDAGHEIAWALEYEPCAYAVHSVRSPLVRRLISTSTHRSPNSATRMKGHVTVDGVRIELGAATGHQGHSGGQRMLEGWTWGRAGGFEQDEHAWFEGITTPKLGRMATSFQVAAHGQRFMLNGLSHTVGLGGPRTEATSQLGQWSMSGECERRAIRANVNATGQQRVKVRYTDTDGRHRFNCMFPTASCALSITPSLSGGNVATTLLSKGRANVEFVAREPLLGSADEYLPRS